MKILAINGSPRGSKSQTLRLVQAVLDGARSAGADVEVVDVCKLHIEYCNGCTVCYERGECVKDDDFAALYEKMCESDGIVLGSPNYIDSVTAPLKAVFDRMADAVHCQMLTDKFGCSVCTAGGSHQDEVVAYMNRVLTNLGATAVGGVGVAVGWDPTALERAESEAFALGKKLAESIRGEHRYPEQEEVHRQRRDYFRQLVMANRDLWRHEYDWYIAMGWIKEE